jgi:hypothetical protein
MAAKGLMIAGQAKHVFDAQGIGSHNIRLQSNPISIAGNHLHNRLYAHTQQVSTRSNARHSDYSRLVICNINRIYIILEERGLLADYLGVGATGGTNLGSYRKFTLFQSLLQFTAAHIT